MKPRKLLVIEDDIDLLLIITKAARKRGYEPNGTIDPTDALQRARTFSPDVVLLDLHMPRVDGRDLLARLVADPEPPAIIVISGWIDELTHELCRKYGAADIVRKPFELDDLFRRIEAAARIAGQR